jgi:hypothetical protein
MPDRVRVTFYLPVTRTSDRIAYLLALDHIRSLSPRDGMATGDFTITGYTVSADDPVIFGGLYWSAQRHEWVADDVVLLIIDFVPEEFNPARIHQLKNNIARLYASQGAEQDEFYVTVERMSLL